VHYASAGGNIVAFMDRLFYSGAAKLAYKPAAAIVSCRRGGASATFEVLNKYFTINNMPVVSANYWNEVHGNTAEEAEKDEEGMQTMRYIGYNMGWLLQCIALGKSAGIEPQKESKIRTNFIR
jgi:multimeric flavodoxin WrbA